MKDDPPSLDEMLGWTAVVSVFVAQQLVNGWKRAYGIDHVRDVQSEIDRRRAKESKK